MHDFLFDPSRKLYTKESGKTLSCIASNTQGYVSNFMLTSNLVLNMQKQPLVGILQIRSFWKFHNIHRATPVNFVKFFSIAFIKNTTR